MNKEIEILLGGKSHILCPTFHALSAIEKELATGMTVLAKKLSEGLLSLEELAVIVGCCVESNLSSEHLKEHIAKSGLAHVMQSVAAMFAHVFGGTEASIKHDTTIAYGDLKALMEKFPD